MSTAISTQTDLFISTETAAAVEPAAGCRTCRFCGSPLAHTVVDLGMSPLCESYVSAENLDAVENFYPLRVYVCQHCLLVQLPQYVSAESIFSDYAYFSSYSDSWLRHARRYSEEMIARFGLDEHSQVIEVASNDGYLLQNFVARGIPVLGIEPAANVARAAVAKGVTTLVKFFGAETARQVVDQGTQADLLAANNVLAHVPKLNDFVAGLKIVLAPRGVLTIEFPHLLRLIAENQFDTIYHEHFCYFSLTTARRVLAAHGLTVFDVQPLPSHGGSLRLLVRHAERSEPAVSPAVAEIEAQEEAAGLNRPEGYQGFCRQVEETRYALVEFLIAARRQGKSVAGYGAPGKGNTLLNYCGIREDLLAYTVDRNPFKQGKYLPGTRIPIYAPEHLAETRPDCILILPWNLKDEIVKQLAYARQWGASLVVPIPRLEICR